MIRTIFHQLWNQRRMNSWIFLELLLVSFFLWVIIDPVCVLLGNYCIDRGYDSYNRYVVHIGVYDDDDENYDDAQTSDSLRLQAYRHIIRIVTSLPEVESYSISPQNSFPNSRATASSAVFPDTASMNRPEGRVPVEVYSFIREGESDLFRTYGVHDVRTGKEVVLPEDWRNKCFLSENLSLTLFGTADAVGQKIIYRGQEMEVAAVFRNYKHNDYEQPYPICLHILPEIEAGTYMHLQNNIVLRLRKEINAEAFRERFCDEIGPKLSIGNFYFKELQNFEELSRQNAELNGIFNKLRMQYSLAGFAVLCIFLGMLGTFWIRSNARRQEIGVMRSMGASSATISCQFLTEAWLLVSVAFLLALPFLWHRATIDGFYVVEGFASDSFVPDTSYWQNRFTSHFCIVSLLSYLLLLAISLIGTYIPVHRASRTLPAEALRDE